MPAALDHLVLAVPDLDEAVLAMTRRTGVQPVAGGSHPGLGTRNALVGLSWQGSRRRYLELLAPDPEQPRLPAERTMLGVGRVASPTMHGWAIRLPGEELDATMSRARRAGVDVGEVVAAQRATPHGPRLSWRLAAPQPLGLGGVQPFLIDWHGGTHPTDVPLPTLELVDLALLHPDPERATGVLRTLGVGLPVSPGSVPRLRATLATPEGELVLG